MNNLITQSPRAIAMNRFGLGANSNPDLRVDPKKWLHTQFEHYQNRPPRVENLAKTGDIFKDLAQQQNLIQNADAASKSAIKSLFQVKVQDTFQKAVIARTEYALVTPTPFLERLVYFWSNHFAISAGKQEVVCLSGAFENEAIRPHVLGNFKDLLFAVEKHPAMLIFLDQDNSIGPNSKAGKNQANKKRGLNENLAREIMELHTLGVRSGYSQHDVTEFARTLTGWCTCIGNKRRVDSNPFAFIEARHEPGARTLLGKTYPQADVTQAEAVLLNLATSDATAQHIAFKLARHFVNDNPPKSIVDKLAYTFKDSGGDLKAVYRVLIEAPEAWHPTPEKFKTPWEWLISTVRCIGAQTLDNIAPLLNQLGQPLWNPGSPAGYEDIATTWMSSNALLLRVEAARVLAKRLGFQGDVNQLMKSALLGAISPQTESIIKKTKNPVDALALFLVSPEFLRR